MNKDLLVAIIIFKIWIILIVFTLIFSSQKDKAIESISKKYQYNHKERDKYIENVKECFDMWENIKIRKGIK